MYINIKDAKKVLVKLLKKVEKNKTEENIKNFDLILRYLYHNQTLQQQSQEWTSGIENKEISEEIQNMEEFNPFYFAHSSRSKFYKFYVNSLGIVLLVKTETEEDYYYSSGKSDEGKILRIGLDGCLDEKAFNNEDAPVYIGHLKIYDLIKESKLFRKPIEDGYELHHIVCNYDKNNKNDARDNRQDNMIAIPKDLHRHAELSEEEKEFAEDKYKEYL